MDNKRWAWDEGKNLWLIASGRPTFDDVVSAIQEGGILEIRDHPSRPGQKIMVVLINNYPHAVPFEQRADVAWLITVYPARKYKK